MVSRARYFESDSWSVNNFEPLEFSSVRHIKEVILQCKAIYRRTSVPTHAENGGALGAGGEAAAAAAPLSARGDGGPHAHGSRGEPRALSEAEGTQGQAGHHHHGGPSLQHHPSPSAPHPNQDAFGEASPRSEGSGSGGSGASAGNGDAHGLDGGSASALDPGKIEAYKKGPGRQLQQALDENRMLVKTKKKESNMLAKQMSVLIKRMKAGGAGAGAEDAEVQDLKAEYRELHQERTMLLSEIEYCKKLVAECSKKLVEGVNQCLKE